MLLAMIIVFVGMRLFLHTFPDTNLDIGEYNIHHLFTGILLMVVAGLPLMLRLPTGFMRWGLAATYGAGLAMVLDEWVYLIVTDGSDSEYTESASVYGAAALIAIVAIYITVLAWKRKSQVK